MNRRCFVACVLLAFPAIAAPKLRDLPVSDNTVLIETSLGTITLELNAEKAPISADNFKAYVAAGQYDGLIFHRVIPDFMIQGGGMDEKMNQKKTNPPIKNESLNGLKNDRGTVAMARTNLPDSATCQFFINHKDNDFLNGDPATGKIGYAVFAKVTAGMDIVDKIAAVKTGKHGPHSDVPLNPVTIKSIKMAGK
jgi:cyclophilin family peptidyl-prolyl cis-trans isomerase